MWDDPHVSNAGSTSVPAAAQENVLTLLYTDLGLTRMRPLLDGGVEPINDNVDPAHSTGSARIYARSVKSRAC